MERKGGEHARTNAGRAMVPFGLKRRTTTAPASAVINADIRATSLDW
jgi:hypothetical protein